MHSFVTRTPLFYPPVVLEYLILILMIKASRYTCLANPREGPLFLAIFLMKGFSLVFCAGKVVIQVSLILQSSL